MSHNYTSITLSTWGNSLVVLPAIQYTHTMATLHKEAHIHLNKVITMGSQHLVLSSHQLAAHIMLGSHHTSTLELQCKDSVTKVTSN